ncbi:MAG: hypothetical protein SPI18_04670 [Prevotella sp.]|nr:hypothetical protein [Prevotella sp.]
MNEISNETNAVVALKAADVGRRVYVKPECEIVQIHADAKSFICTSVGMDQKNSEEAPWDPETSIEGEEFEFE